MFGESYITQVGVNISSRFTCYYMMMDRSTMFLLHCRFESEEPRGMLPPRLSLCLLCYSSGAQENFVGLNLRRGWVDLDV